MINILCDTTPLITYQWHIGTQFPKAVLFCKIELMTATTDELSLLRQMGLTSELSYQKWTGQKAKEILENLTLWNFQDIIYNDFR
jgi:hypothetical protein